MKEGREENKSEGEKVIIRIPGFLCILKEIMCMPCSPLAFTGFRFAPSQVDYIFVVRVRPHTQSLSMNINGV